MPFANLMASLLIQEAQRAQEKERRFRERELAISILEVIDDYQAQFLIKRINQRRAECTWSEVNSQCLRLTVTYRGREWRIRVPVPT